MRLYYRRISREETMVKWDTYGTEQLVLGPTTDPVSTEGDKN